MTFQESVKTCLTEKYAAFSGRGSRSEYWWFILAYVIVMFVASLLGWIIQLVAGLALLAPVASAGYRRLQDTGRPGWYIFIPIGLSILTMLVAPDMSGMEPGVMPDASAMPSGGSMMVTGLLGIVQLIVALVFLWWLTRPSEEGANAYGPPPAK